MGQPTTPEPIHILRGKLRLLAALQPDADPLRPTERLCLLAILRVLDTALEITDQAPPNVGVLLGVFDGYRRELARLGAPR